MEENNKENNFGCVIFFVILGIAMIIYTVNSMSQAEISEVGTLVLACLGLGVGAYVIDRKLKYGNTEHKSKNNKSWLSVLLIVLGVIIVGWGIAFFFNLISIEFSYIVGIIVIVAIVIGICVGLYNMK